MTLQEDVKRRKILKTLGAGATGGILLAGSATASPQNNFGYIEQGGGLAGQTVTLAGEPRREKVFCAAGGSQSRIKTQVWGLDESEEEIYLIPSGYEEGDELSVGPVFTACPDNDDIEGEVSVEKV